jgi:hypothetical protein
MIVAKPPHQRIKNCIRRPLHIIIWMDGWFFIDWQSREALIFDRSVHGLNVLRGERRFISSSSNCIFGETDQSQNNQPVVIIFPPSPHVSPTRRHPGSIYLCKDKLCIHMYIEVHHHYLNPICPRESFRSESQVHRRYSKFPTTTWGSKSQADHFRLSPSLGRRLRQPSERILQREPNKAP